MNFQRPITPVILILVSAGIIIALLVLGNSFYTENTNHGESFLPAWAGTHLWVMDELSPYRPQAAEMAQRIFYGRLAPSWRDPLVFDFPFYSVWVFRLFSYSEDFSLAQAYWMALLEISLVGIGLVSLSLTRWKPNQILGGLFWAFVLFNYHSLLGLSLGSPAIFCAALIGISLLLIQNKRYSMAGICMAFATIKPEMSLLLIIFMIIWTYSHRIRDFIFSFFGTMLVLVWWANANLQGWFLAYLQNFTASLKFAGPIWIWELFEIWWGLLGRQIGLVIAVVLAVMLVREWALAWRKDERWFLWTAGLTIVASNIIGWLPNTANFVMMIPAMVMVFSIWQQRWGGSSRWIIGVVLVVFGLGLWGVNNWLGMPKMIEPVWLYIAYPGYLLVMLFWIRHWAIGSRMLSVEKLEALKNL